MSRLLQYYDCVVRPILISQYNYLDEKKVPYIDSVKLGISFNNLADDDDWRLVVGLKLLTALTGQKASLGKLYWSMRGGRERKFVGSCFVTLRGRRGLMFLEYFLQVVYPLNSRRYGMLDCVVSDEGDLNFVLKDLGVFYRQSEDLIGFDGKISLTVVVGGGDVRGSESLLEAIGFKIKKK